MKIHKRSFKLKRKPDRIEAKPNPNSIPEKIDTLEVATEVTPFIGMKGQRTKNRRFQSKPNAVFSFEGKGIMSNDERLLKVTEELQGRLEEVLAPEFRDGFALKHPITSDFSALRTVSGYYSNPTDIPPRDNTDALRGKGINVDGFVDSEARIIAESVFELLMEDRDNETSVRFAKVSSTSIPFFTNDVRFKQELISFLTKNCDKIRELIMTDRFEELARYYIWFAYTLQVRLQAEGGTKGEDGWTPKERPVRLWDGTTVIADKLSELQSEGIQGHWANRVRTVFATPAAISYILTTVLTPRRKAGLNRFAFSLHHTGALDLYQKMKRFGTRQVIGIDVKQMDNNYPTYFGDFISDEHDKFFDPSIGKALKWLTHAPFYSAAPGPEYEGGWRGSPFDKNSFNLNYGLPSGIPDVSSRGKYWVLFSLAYDIQNLTGRMWDKGADKSVIKSSIAKFLSGEHDFIACFNTGDDTVLLLNDESLAYEKDIKDFLDRKLEIKPAHALYERDDSVSYLGLIFMKDSLGNIIVPKPNALTYALKPFAPERGVFDKQRMYWGAGMIERGKYYAEMGDTKEIIDTEIRSVWSKHFDIPDPIQLAMRHADTNPFPHFSGDQASFEVLEDPSKMHYKYDEGDIDPAVLDSVSLSYTQEQLDPLYKIFEL